MTMQSGSVVVYREHGHLVLGVVHKISSSSDAVRIELTAEDGKKIILPQDRVMFDCKHTLALTGPSAELKRQLQALHEQIRAAAQTIDLKELWELLQDETTEAWPWKELAGLVLSTQDTPIATAGVLESLYGQTLYFKERKAGEFTLRDAKSIEEVLHQQQREHERAQAQEGFFAWLQGQLAGPLSAPPPSGADRYLDLIKGLALYGEFYDKRSQALRLLDEIGYRSKGHPWDVAFQLLVALKLWTPDEELSLLRYQIPTQFSAEVIQAAEGTAAFPQDAPQVQEYTDLSALFTFTIDDAETTDIDDALSIHIEDGKIIVGIHITDVGYFVAPESELDKAALARGTSVYLPVRRFPMLPPTLSEEKASLCAGSLRPSLSFFAQIDDQGNIHNERICSSILRVGRRLTYSEADGMLRTGDDTEPCTSALHRLLQITQIRKALRIAQGAVVIEGEEVKVRITNGDISVAVLPPDSPSRALVSECMILANEMAARYCHTHQLPALYIAQPEPDEPVPAAMTFPTQRVFVHTARRAMKPSQMGTTPAAHAALGLQLYTQATSPLRRYHDLQMQRQIKHHLTHGAALFNEEQLQIIAASAQEASGNARRCERESTRYWLLRYLEKQKGRTVQGQVVREQYGRSFIELDETLLIVAVNASPPLPLGSPAQVVISHVDARRDILTVRLT
ncbi:MAG: VacB/RNase II family 3'-5' exoribonuclease [Deltaproteobacteria bacterium]|nr:VacB/RNase II family 3'-5' exoribonuclease [Deltaproteobacteria bacterium]